MEFGSNNKNGPPLPALLLFSINFGYLIKSGQHPSYKGSNILKEESYLSGEEEIQFSLDKEDLVSSGLWIPGDTMLGVGRREGREY